jgi:hypothetical protein
MAAEPSPCGLRVKMNAYEISPAPVLDEPRHGGRYCSLICNLIFRRV